MKCNQCGKDMDFMGTVALQDDYTATEDLCFNFVERFRCNDCEITSEFLKAVNKDDSSVKTTSGFKVLNSEPKKKKK